MRRILDDDDDLEEEDELVGRLPLGLEQDSVDGGPPAGVPASQDPSQAEVSEIDDETYERSCPDSYPEVLGLAVISCSEVYQPLVHAHSSLHQDLVEGFRYALKSFS